ncbi:MAG: type I-B CRISPR-associated protein Cas5 [Aquificae bacterium]|nr:type I-B CRISPR-associated protein Cas5 [Aquificota bacterium]
MKVLVFDIWGDFGHFKKYYTTASPLTFSVPPPTAIFGMLGAILGLDKEEYLNHINGRTTKIGIQILKPIKKTRMTLNLIDTKNSGSFHLIKNRTQIKTEFLKEPAYRLYVNMEKQELFNRLTNLVQNKESYYTLSLGLANLLANYRYIGLYDAKPIEEATEVHSIVLAENIKELVVEEGKKYSKEKLPLDMNPDREVLSYKDVVMEVQGRSLRGKFLGVYKSGGRENFSFL